jgi:ceramide glucosyltransferase
LGVRRHRRWLGPLRDLLAFAVHVASFFVDEVTWRDRRYKVRADGTLIALGEPKA